MKFSCEKHLLLAAVNTASRAAAAKSPIPALEGILIEAGEHVKLTGYDLKEGIYTSIPADVATPGAAVLGARLLGEIVRSLPDGVVTISIEKGTLANISCGKSEFSIMGTAAADYPEIQGVEEGFTFSLPQKTLRSMIDQTIFAVSSNESRPVYTGSLFEIENGTLCVVSVDGYRLAMRREKLELDGAAVSFIVPGAALSDAVKICADADDPVEITVGAKQIRFSFGETVLISRRLEGEFINYKKTVPANFTTFAVAEKADFQRVIERVSLIIDDKIKSPLRCTFSIDSVELLCVTSLGRAEDSVSVEGAGLPLEIGFNNRYLLDAVKAAPSEKLKVCLGNSTSPCVIVPEDDADESFLFMILPVRLPQIGN
ncbi:MAG: DNA polymerase III subunit beta [Firmicutes bacterium]|nr:DNA polymerase III subunit beta [Bacillota bacterium]